MELPVIGSIPDSVTFASVGPEYATVVGLLGLLGGEFLIREADSLYPPVLAPAGYRPHVVVEVGAEYVVEVGLAELGLIDDIA